MKEWFTIEQLDQDTYAISEYQHWEETHCYLLLGEKRALLIDTGLGAANIKEVVSSLTMLPVCVLLTHAHWDHIGAIEAFTDCMVHTSEVNWLNGSFPLPLSVVKQNLCKEPCEFPSSFDINAYHIPQREAKGLQDGDVIDLGNRILRIIHTPVHSPGHICLYEESRKTLYCGDLMYAGCLYAFYPTTDPVMFRDSIHKINTLSIDQILPGHHRLYLDSRIRYDIQQAFDDIDAAGNLKQGYGVVEYDEFSIHI